MRCVKIKCYDILEERTASIIMTEFVEMASGEAKGPFLVNVNFHCLGTLLCSPPAACSCGGPNFLKLSCMTDTFSSLVSLQHVVKAIQFFLRHG